MLTTMRLFGWLLLFLADLVAKIFAKLTDTSHPCTYFSRYSFKYKLYRYIKIGTNYLSAYEHHSILPAAEAEYNVGISIMCNCALGAVHK